MINISFGQIIKNIILKNKYLAHSFLYNHPNSKYSIENIIDDILFVLKTGIAWRNIKSQINWHSLYWHYKRLVKFDIFKKTYMILLKIYSSYSNFNVQIIDSSFIQNKYGKNKIARNKFFKSKNCNKVSLVTDVTGIPISVLIDKGNVHDLHFIKKHSKDLIIFNNKHKVNHPILLADKAYESLQVRRNLANHNYVIYIPKKKGANNNHPFNKTIYKKRIIIEHTFQKLKAFRKIMVRYESLIKNYLGFLYLAISNIIYNKIIALQ